MFAYAKPEQKKATKDTVEKKDSGKSVLLPKQYRQGQKHNRPGTGLPTKKIYFSNSVKCKAWSEPINGWPPAFLCQRKSKYS